MKVARACRCLANHNRAASSATKKGRLINLPPRCCVWGTGFSTGHFSLSASRVRLNMCAAPLSKCLQNISYIINRLFLARAVRRDTGIDLRRPRQWMAASASYLLRGELCYRSLGLFNAKLSPKEHWRGPQSQEDGKRERRERERKREREKEPVPNDTLSPPQQVCIRAGTDVIRFYCGEREKCWVFFIVRNEQPRYGAY